MSATPLTFSLSSRDPIRIAVLRNSADIRTAHDRSGAMQWFEATARALLIAVVVLTGAAVIRNVTDAFTAVTTHAPAMQRTAQR
jgi:hypothetical protein